VVSAALVLVVVHVDRRAGATAVLAPAVALYAVGLSRGRVEQVAAALAAVAAVVVADVVVSDRHALATVALVTIEKASREALDEHRAVVGVLRDRDAGGGAPVDPAPTLGDLG
jgi:hypothetical protein